MARRAELPIPREARPYQGMSAGLVTRLAAATVDGLVVAALMLGGYAGLAGALLLLDPRGFQMPDMSLALNVTVGFLTAVGYLTLAWALSGRSIGQLLLGLRVRGRGGRSIRFTGALVRAVACVFFPVGLLWCAVSPRNRSLQDVLLRTVVVYDWSPRSIAAAAVPDLEP